MDLQFTLDNSDLWRVRCVRGSAWERRGGRRSWRHADSGSTRSGAGGLSRPLIAGVLAAVFLLGGAAAAVAQELALEDAVAAAIERSSALAQSELRTELARLRAETVADASDTRWTVSGDPVYALNTRRAADFASVSNPADFPPAPTTTLTNTTGGTVSVQQPLPTSGVLSGSVGTSFSANTTFPEDGDAATTFSLTPSASVALSQPLFVDGAFIDTRQPELTLEQAERGVSESRVTERQVRQQTAVTVARLFVQLDSLRRAMELQQSQRSLLQAQLEQARIRSEQGQGSQQEVFGLEVQLNRSEDAMLQTRLSARELELELSRITGLDISADTELTGIEPLSGRLEAVTAEAGSTLDLQAAELAIDRARTDLELARKQEAATAQLSLALSPRYADARENADSLTGAVTDYFGEGGGLDVALSLGLTVPLDQRATNERERRQAEISLDIAQRERDRIALEQATRFEVARERIAILQERIELLAFEIEFEQEQLASEEELVEIGASTQLRVQQLRGTVISREGELADLHAQLVLERLDLAARFASDPVGVLTGGD